MVEGALKLTHGRQLGYGIYGNPGGIPILDFHGIPGSRREAQLIAEFLNRDGLCLVGFDRPGYGISSYYDSFQFSRFCEDVVTLADHLGINRFIGLGFSGGSLFALATARLIPDRFTALGIVSGLGPGNIGSEGMHSANRKKFNLAQRWPLVARWMLTFGFSSLRRNPETLPIQLKKLWQKMPVPDQKVLQDKKFADGIMDVTRDAISKGVHGWVNEEVQVAQPWTFRLNEIHCPNIYLWHGTDDQNVPLAMGKAVASQLNGCQAEFITGEGHLSLLYHHGQAIIEKLVQAASPE